MIASLRLLPLLIRRAPRQAAGAINLCGAGVAIATLVAGTVLSAWAGFGLREPRIVWRDPTPAASIGVAPTALQRRNTVWFQGQRIEVIELAPIGSLADAPVAPGLRSAPTPGTTWVSPALHRLLHDHPNGHLGARFGNLAGEIGRAGLAHPDELVAVVGRSADQLPSSAAVPDPAVEIASFDTRGTDRTLVIYRNLSLVAAVLVTVPAILLVGSAARLTAARREQRMAALRLAGATPRSVRALAAAETTIGAGIGAVAGVAASAAISPLLASVEMGGGRWFPIDLRLSISACAAIVAAAIVTCAATAAVSLRRVASRPLGVARSTEPQRSRWPRLLGTGAAMVLLAAATVLSASTTFTRDDGQPVDMTVPMVAALGTVIASLALVGPFFTSLVGRAMVRSARRAPMLIAGRRVLEDPRATYRTVSAVVLAGMVAGFLSGVVPTAQHGGEMHANDVFASDILRGSLAVMVACLVLAFGASAIASAASVVDQRRVIGRLTLCGTDVATLQRARRFEAVLPLAAATIGSIGLGLGSSVLLMRGFGAPAERISTPDIWQLVAIAAAAIAMGYISATLSRPLLVAAARQATTSSAN